MSALVAALGLVYALGGQESARCDLSLTLREPWIQPGKPFEVALGLIIEPKWHIYWMNPGDTGAPTEVRWKLPGGYRIQSVRWSRPARHESAAAMAYGYEGRAYAVARILAPSTAKPGKVSVTADVNWLICNEICLIGKDSKTAAFPVRVKDPGTFPAKPDFWQEIVATLPPPATGSFSAAVKAEEYMLKFRPASATRKTPKSAYFYAYASNVVEHGKPQSLSENGDTFQLRIPRSSYEKGPAKSLEGVLELNFADGSSSASVIRVPVHSTRELREDS